MSKLPHSPARCPRLERSNSGPVGCGSRMPSWPARGKRRQPRIKQPHKLRQRAAPYLPDPASLPLERDKAPVATA
ncbi:uncharacterized protein BDZ83DRAFT_165527 [Colletotrichum acutatum]|uniref:Uncharacterized protein n=1 Tax=Glomerella acutata TaxID=27357 RepID=A0AAD8XQF3_GLOAC|nr:uncharacterized protein BDZ83DRAFT_165527 [Colletotrichum acutatum]KAK1731611.1 hypothetical protein BDZ83DRAFT_165527 [Colletotrichum acutatum]